MPMLDPLIEAIETVKEQIDQHWSDLEKNETQTREALINPILKALGWDPANLALVKQEFKIDASWSVDYALRGAGDKGMLFAIIEAKKLDEPLEKHRTQALNYAHLANVGYAGLTNGNRWELYTFFEQGPLFEQGPIKGRRRIYISRVEISIVEDPPHECALELLALWRPNLASGNGKKPKKSIIVNGSVPPPPDNLIPLSECRPKIGDPPPSAIRLPDGSEHPTRSKTKKRTWIALLMKTAEWLCEKDLLTDGNVPVPAGPVKYIVNTSNFDKNGKGMKSWGAINNGRYYVDKDLKCFQICNNARKLLEHCSKDPSEVFLKFANVEKGNDG